MKFVMDKTYSQERNRTTVMLRTDKRRDGPQIMITVPGEEISRADAARLLTDAIKTLEAK